MYILFCEKKVCYHLKIHQVYNKEYIQLFTNHAFDMEH